MMNSVHTGRTRGRPRLSDGVASDLERRILGGELEPGELLSTEVQLGAELGVSRTVIRDAIRTLAARGLVEVRQGAGTRVSSPDVAAFEQAMTTALLRSDVTMGDVVDARAALEVALVELAATAGQADDWDRMEEALAALSAAIEADDWVAAHQQHLDFHLGILGAVHLPALELVLRPMHQLVMLSSTPPSAENPWQWEFEAHRALLEALRRGPAAARRALEDHYSELAADSYTSFRAARFRDAPSVAAIVERRLRPGC